MSVSATRLTKHQIDRQDFVDNQIFELVQELAGSSKQIEWDVEAIGAVRDAIQKQFVGKGKGVTEKQFYPYFKIYNPQTARG